MAVSFKVPASPSRSTLTIDTFKGADFTNDPASVDIDKSPNVLNMIREVPGKVRKSMGYKTMATYSGAINGYHTMHGKAHGLLHVGTKIIETDFDGNDTEKYSGANDARSRSWQFKDKVCILDGKALLIWDGNDVNKAETNATIPVTLIGGNPAGGGTSYRALNLLTPGFTEQFLGTVGTTEYHLSVTDLDATPVTAQVMKPDGTFADLVEGGGFSVNRTTGVVSFNSPPGESYVTGEDNVKITAYKTVSGYADRINKCAIGVLYGASGDLNRLFVSGNPDDEYINYQWFSATNDPTYFPDTNYQIIGTSKSAIVGYTVINSYLAVFKDKQEVEQNIVLVGGTTLNNEVTFSTQTTLHGAPAISKDAFAYLAGEPLFLTDLGIYAITSQDITGREYTNLRSFYLNGKLLKESNLDKAFAFVYKDFYILAINGVFYILDGLQPIQTDKSAPYATRQFVGYYRTNVDANCMWEEGGALWFGSKTGKVCKFYTNSKDIYSYNDDGAVINARWETPDFDGKLFYKNKTFRYLAVRLEQALTTSIRLSAMKRGIWTVLSSDSSTAYYLSFSGLIFSKFSFSSDTTNRIIALKTRIKKVDKARYRFENIMVNEPFALDKIGIEYVEKGNYKQ
jgi:hypothetical protein